MELRQLEYFVTVAEEANFTRAAAKLHVAQPGVSAQIRRLERELGQPLLDRSGRSVRLTEAGAAALPYARAALAAVSGARLAVDELTGLLKGHLAIGAVTSHNVDLPALISEFHDDHPGVEVTLASDSADRLIDALHTGALDAAIIAYGAPPPGLELLVLTDESIMAGVGHNDPLASHASIPLRALRERSLICLPRGGGIRAILEDACADAGFSPHVAFEASSPEAIAGLACRGLGVAILPSSVAQSSPDLHPLAITEPSLGGRLAFAWRTEGPHSPATRALIARARRMLRP